ncbi:MAG: DedA family protein [Chloroflexi bacterium]|nr:DedA family protein [Chloroflexota bacterium]
MGEEEFLEFQSAIQDLIEVAPLEALPVEALPALTIGWFARVLRVFARHAYALAFVGALIENTILLGFLLPGGTVVALAAVGARMAQLPLWLVVLLSACGMTGGALIDYWLGRSGAGKLLRHRRAGRFGQRAALQLDEAQPLLRRHGWWIILIAHAFGHGRSALAVAAGASRLPLGRFLLMEFPAALLWSAVFAGGGYLLAAEWSTLELAMRRAGWIGAGIAALVTIGGWLWRRRLRDRSQMLASEPSGPDGPGGTSGVPVTAPVPVASTDGAAATTGATLVAPRPTVSEQMAPGTAQGA